MIRDWKAYLLDRAGGWGLPENGDWRFLFYNNYNANGSDIDLLWFHGRDRFPRVVTKLSEDRARLETEFQNLQRVHAAAAEWSPEPLYFGEQGGLWAVWMKGLAGTRFNGVYTGPVLRSIVDAVTSLHRSLQLTGAIAQPDRHRRSVIEPFECLASFGTSPAVIEGCRRIRRAAAEEWVQGLAVIPQHGDLYAGNLLSDGERWSIVDWENFGAVDLPACDIYTLLISVLRKDGATVTQWDAALAAQMSGLARRYAQSLGIAVADLRLLLSVSLANWFYIQWKSGRMEFLKSFYVSIEDYFENTGRWEAVFLDA